jgi:hypothetical protein
MLEPLVSQAGQAAGIHQGHCRLVYGVRFNYYSYLCTYDLYGREEWSGRGLGPANKDFFGPCEVASSR